MSAGAIALPARPRILVIALRRLGDVLLSTPLIRSIRHAWPDAHIDALVFADTAGILAGNPDLNDVLSMPSSPTTWQSVALARRLFRRYDLAVSTQTGDRPTTYAILAGRMRAAPVSSRLSGRIKRLFLHCPVPQQLSLHRVEEVLRIADALGIECVPKVVPPSLADYSEVSGDYAVIHAAPFFDYKKWTISGWRAIASTLASRGLKVVVTGGESLPERSYLDKVWAGLPVLRRDGKLSWSELSGLLATARVYIGPDTSVTHLAAASGCPTIALYGPTDPRLWGPWPKGGLSEAWAAAASCQRRGNVWILQHVYPCLPCQLEGCERHQGSESTCLRHLAADQVCAIIDSIVAAGNVQLD